MVINCKYLFLQSDSFLVVIFYDICFHFNILRSTLQNISESMYYIILTMLWDNIYFELYFLSNLSLYYWLLWLSAYSTKLSMPYFMNCISDCSSMHRNKITNYSIFHILWESSVFLCKVLNLSRILSAFLPIIFEIYIHLLPILLCKDSNYYYYSSVHFPLLLFLFSILIRNR